MLFVTVAAAAPVVPYYETTNLRTVVDRAASRADLTRALRQAGLRLVLEHPNGLQEDVRPSSRLLSDAVVATALTPFAHQTVGAELDLVASRTDTWLLLVTLRWEEGQLVVSQARHPRGLLTEGPDEATIRQRWGIGPLVAEDRPFDSLARGLVDEALARLSPEERALAARLPFHRVSGPDLQTTTEGTLLAAYVPAALGAQIEIYDAAVEPTPHFVGEPTDPRPYALAVLLHELGHAVAMTPFRTAQLLIEDIHTAWERDRFAVEAARATPDAPDAAAKIESLEARMARREAAVRGIGAWLDSNREGAAAVWSVAVGDEPAPTPYGRTTAAEGFAEAFALYHCDRRALERAAPKSAAWLAQGGHLEAVRAQVAEVEALAMSGFR